MLNHRVPAAALAAAMLVAACYDNPSAPVTAGARSTPGTSLADLHDHGEKPVTVMTRNLYLGADLTRVIAEPNPLLIPQRVADSREAQPRRLHRAVSELRCTRCVRDCPRAVSAAAWMDVGGRQARGETFRFFNTHLEVAAVAPVQVAQGNEAIALLASSPYPVIAVGDFNSAADGSGTPTYANLINVGQLRDAWPLTNSSVGLTCCQSEDLRNTASINRTRIDLVLFDGLLNALDADLFGATPAELTPSGLWPSDHAGVAATLSLKDRGR